MLRIGKYLIDCQYRDSNRCTAQGTNTQDGYFSNADWKPEDCRDCYQVRFFEELKEARLQER